MKKHKFFFGLGMIFLLLISGTTWAADQPDLSQGIPAILASLDKNGVVILDDSAAAAIRGQAETKYVLVKILGVNTFDGGMGVKWTGNPLYYRYGYWGGPGWGAGVENPSNAVALGFPTIADTMDGWFQAHDLFYLANSTNEARLLADKGLLSGLSSLPNANYPYWGYIYFASPSGLTSPYVSVAGASLIGGKIFFGWRNMPYTEYSRREAMAALGVMVFGRSVVSSIKLQ
jgi:hypothetical protein